MLLVPLSYVYLTGQHMPGTLHSEKKEDGSEQLISQLEVLICSFRFSFLFIYLYVCVTTE